MDWFAVDKRGLAAIMARRSPGWVLLEPIQNALDKAGVGTVAVTLESVLGARARARLTVTDNAPEGFKRLSDVWTLFAASYKAGNPEQRGRFNLGEKLLLSLANEAEIVSTTGGVRLDDKGRHTLRRRTDRGAMLTLTIRLTQEQVKEALAEARRVLVPDGVTLLLNGERVPHRDPIGTTRAALPTVLADAEGALRPTSRVAVIRVFEPVSGWAGVYEMGIPVVAWDCPWSADVGQKIPVSLEREDVPEAFRRKLLAAVLNVMAEEVRPEHATEGWCREAAGSPECSPEAFTAYLDARFGADRAMADPSDPEAGKRAISHGWTLVHGNQLSEGERETLRRAREAGDDPLVPARRTKFATPKPYSDDPNAPPVKVIPEAEWTEGMQRAVRYAKFLHVAIFRTDLHVRIVHTTNGFDACYESKEPRLDLNLLRLGHGWVDGTNADALVAVNALLIHEFGHAYEPDHLSAGYHKALCHLGARLARLILEGEIDPHDYGWSL